MKSFIIFCLFVVVLTLNVTDQVEAAQKEKKISNPKVIGTSTKTTPSAYKKIIKIGDDFENIIEKFLTSISGSSNYIPVSENAITPNPSTIAKNFNFRFDLQVSQKGKVDNYQLQINKNSKLKMLRLNI